MRLQAITDNRIEQFKADMKAAFRFGAAEGMGTDEEVLSEDDLVNSLKAKGAIAYADFKKE